MVQIIISFTITLQRRPQEMQQRMRHPFQDHRESNQEPLHQYPPADFDIHNQPDEYPRMNTPVSGKSRKVKSIPLFSDALVHANFVRIKQRNGLAQCFSTFFSSSFLSDSKIFNFSPCKRYEKLQTPKFAIPLLVNVTRKVIFINATKIFSIFKKYSINLLVS